MRLKHYRKSGYNSAIWAGKSCCGIPMLRSELIYLTKFRFAVTCKTCKQTKEYRAK